MGGLRQSMPYTHATFLIGTLALVGIPIFAGFWSKDAILAATLAEGGALGWTSSSAGFSGRSSPACTRSGSTSSSSTGSRPTLRTPRTTTHTTARARAGCSFPWACWRSARRSRDCCRSRASGTRSTSSRAVEPLVHPTTGQAMADERRRGDARRPRRVPRLARVHAGRELVPRAPCDGPSSTSSGSTGVRHRLRTPGAGDRRPAARPGRDARRPGWPRRGRGGDARRRQDRVTPLGCSRTYALAITVTVSILALVFLVVR